MSSAIPSRQKTGSFSKGTMRPPPAPNPPRSFTQQRSQYLQSQAIPPSSIATIVQNYSKAGEGQAGLPNKDAFQQLLAEILGPEESGGFDEDISTNYKVIQVVTSAGLSTLFQDDPFANTEDQMLQASNSLLVIKLMIQRTPAVLFCPPPADNSQADHLLLYLWLMPRLFPLLGHPQAQALVVEFLETIEAMFFAVFNLQQYWLHLNIMVAYCRACSNCLTSTLQTSSSVKDTFTKTFKLELPPPEFAIDPSILKDVSSFDPRNIRFTLNTVEHVSLLGVHLFSLLARIITSPRDSPRFMAIDDNFTFTQYGVSKIWSAMRKWDSLPIMREKTPAIYMVVLSALDTALQRMSTLEYNIKYDGLYLFSINCVIDTLKRVVDQMNQPAELAVAGIILSLLTALPQSLLVQELLKDKMFPTVFAMISNEQYWKILCSDMQIVICRLILQIAEDETIIQKTRAAFDAINGGGEWTCKDRNLSKKLADLPVLEHHHSLHEGTKGPRKRQKLDIFPEGLKESLICKAYSLLGGQKASDLAGLSQVASTGFERLPEKERRDAVHTLGLLACAISGSLERKRDRNEYIYKCNYCDSDLPLVKRERQYATDGSDVELLKTLEALYKLDSFTESSEIRALGVASLKRMTNHTLDTTHLNLDLSKLGQWNMSLLGSRRRELRIAAGRTIPSFLTFTHDKKTLERNRHVIIENLKILTDSQDVVVQETCVLAWGQIGRVSTDHELNIALLTLVDHLGHPNELVIGASWNELNHIVTAHETQAKKLLTPFWRSISVMAIKKLQSRPQIAQTLATFVDMKLPELLISTQAYTLPYLVLAGKTDVISKIGKAHNPPKTIQLVLFDNLGAILPVLLTQDVPDVEKHTIHLLESASAEFSAASLSELTKSYSLDVAVELLKLHGEVDENNLAQKELTENALRVFTKLAYKPPENQKVKNTNGELDYLALFFQNHVLGVCTLLNRVLKDTRKSADADKIRCLKAIQAMSNIAAPYIISALPQICAYAQSALENEALNTEALKAWATLVRNLKNEELVPLLSQTYSIVLRFWSVFDDEAKEVAINMTSKMFTSRRELMKESVGMIPSLESIPQFANIEKRLKTWRQSMTPTERLHQLAARCAHENVVVVEYALIELRQCIQANQDFIYAYAGSHKQSETVSELVRCLLDVIVTFKDPNISARPRIERLCAECLGLIGAVNPNVVEAPRVTEDMTVLYNFDNFANAEESAEFAMFFLEKIVVKQFLSATDTKSQGFMAWCAQDLLDFCQNSARQLKVVRHKTDQRPPQTKAQKRWDALEPAAREALMPFLNSKYSLIGEITRYTIKYPLFQRGIRYDRWLIAILTELLCKPVGDNAARIFGACLRICTGQDISISKFLFPVAVLHVAISGSDKDRQEITTEFLAILNFETNENDDIHTIDTLRECVETIFSVVDHMTKWLAEKRQDLVRTKNQQARQQNRHYSVEEDDRVDPSIRRVKTILEALPAELMAQRSLEHNSYARSLLYWEQHIRQASETTKEKDLEPLYEKLQHIYTHIDEPDGMFGISAKLPTLDIEQQILEHRKAGKWTAVQSWYELLLDKKPDDVEVQTNLISSLRDSGKFEALLHQVDGLMSRSTESHTRLLPFAVEASWVSENWDALDKYLSTSDERTDSLYDIRMGYALSELRKHNMEAFKMRLDSAREGVVKMMTESVTGNIRQCHHLLVQLHVLSEVQSISEALQKQPIDKEKLSRTLSSRLDIMGTYSTDKQYVLAARRAAFQLSGLDMKEEILSAWLSSAKLARKDHNIQQAYNAVHHASMLNQPLATSEHAKILWLENQKKNAIRNITSVISMQEKLVEKSALLAGDIEKAKPPKAQYLQVAKSKLLLARWLEASGQAATKDLLDKFKDASNWFQRWEQGHYYLGRHYNKLYEAEKLIPPNKQSQPFLYGEHAKLIVQNYLRALAFGVKYIFQTMPRLLTVWLDFGAELGKDVDPACGAEEFRHKIPRERVKQLNGLHLSVDKYVDLLGAWMFYTAMPQLMSRIIHPHEKVYSHIQAIIIKVLVTYPQQTMWYLMAASRSTSKERSQRGQRVLAHFKEHLPKSNRGNTNGLDTKSLINEARKLADELITLCNRAIESRNPHLSLKKDFGFRHDLAPCQLVMPTQAVLTVTIPLPGEALDKHPATAFSANPPTIRRFMDDVYIMSSLMKPRKITIEGSDGRLYSFLCKPKDDLRKDMRLMEFNNMINRFFKRDAESSKRNLYIRTYAVTPLNEECGLIEWVNNVQPLREILLHYYRQKNIEVNYGLIRVMLDEACGGDPKNPKPKQPKIFTEKLLGQFPPVLYKWFLEMFSDPSAWFSSRLKYTRTCAVMSMVGTVLGLGDRHGENILFDAKCGDILHVDFNCLFDKGLGFEKPERVPFRLTHNMVDAFGVTGYEGVYRKACESAMRLLRHNEETMMTVLEAFIHDPTLDMVKKSGKNSKPKAPDIQKPPETPKEIMENILGKLKGRWENDTVPLSVEGHVEVLIKKATDPDCLSSMYIGWCPMF